MKAIGTMLRAEARGRWRAWLATALLIGVLGGAVTAAAAGARRTDSAYGRLAQSHHAAQYLVEDFIPNPEAAVVSPATVARLRSVSEADSFLMYDVTTNDYNVVSSPDGRAFGSGLNRPKVLQGRLADPRRVDEAVVDFTATGVRVGQRVRFSLVRSVAGDTHRLDPGGASVPAAVTVVGIVATPTRFPPYTTNSYFTGPSLYATPAFFHRYRGATAALDFSLVTVRAGHGKDFQRQLEALGRGTPVAVQLLGAQGGNVNRSVRLVGTALWLLAGLLLLVAVLVAGQLLARQITLEATDYPGRRALGVTRRQLVALAVGRSAVLGLGGGVVAVGLAVALSPLTPIGIARNAEPTPGASADGLVLVLAALATAVVVTALALWPAWRAAGAAVPDPASGELGGPNRPSAVAGLLRRSALPVTAASGVRLALERGRGRAAVPVWSTIGGAAVSLGALAGSLVFGASLTHLLHTPPLYGVTWDTEIWNYNGPGAVRAAVPVVKADRDVASAAYIQTGLSFRLDGRDVTGFAFEPVQGRFAVAALAGRGPRADDEIVLGTDTARSLHAHVGSSLTGIAENGRATPVAVHVVGLGVLPPGDAAAHLGQGVIVTRRALERLAAGQVRSPYVIAVTFRPGVDRGRAVAALNRSITRVDQNFLLQPPTTPNDLVNFGRIQNLPLILGSVLAVMAAMTLVHLLVTSTRRRRRDLAVLKTLGFTRRQVGGAVVWQAAALGAVALLVGLPLGVALGRIVWRFFADQVGVVPSIVTPVTAVLLVVPVTIVFAAVMALVPAAMASRTHPAVALREE